MVKIGEAYDVVLLDGKQHRVTVVDICGAPTEAFSGRKEFRIKLEDGQEVIMDYEKFVKCIENK